VASNLLDVSMGTINERQIRPLTRLNPDEQRDVWIEVEKRAAADSRQVTAKLVQEVAQDSASGAQKSQEGGRKL